MKFCIYITHIKSYIFVLAKDDIEKRWIKKFDAWCQEFEKYQNSIRQWVSVVSACTLYIYSYPKDVLL